MKLCGAQQFWVIQEGRTIHGSDGMVVEGDGPAHDGGETVSLQSRPPAPEAILALPMVNVGLT